MEDRLCQDGPIEWLLLRQLDGFIHPRPRVRCARRLLQFQPSHDSVSSVGWWKVDRYLETG